MPTSSEVPNTCLRCGSLQVSASANFCAECRDRPLWPAPHDAHLNAAQVQRPMLTLMNMSEGELRELDGELRAHLPDLSAGGLPDLTARAPSADWERCTECNADSAPEHLRGGLCSYCRGPEHFYCKCDPDVARNSFGLPYATHPATWGERTPATLIRERAGRWSARSDKWHRTLETERAWSARGVSAPAFVGTVAAALAAINAWHHVPGAFAYPALAMVIGAAFMWRASLAKVRLEVGRASEAWVIADRYTEHYRGLVAQIDEGRDLLDCLRDSQALEAAARFGLPESVQSALNEVTR